MIKDQKEVVRTDRWKEYDYETYRYLDALARIFSYRDTGGCVAIMNHNSELLVTTNKFFNGNGKVNNNFEKQHFDFISESINDFLQNGEIEQFFNSLIFRQIEGKEKNHQLYSIYIGQTPEFKSMIKNYKDYMNCINNIDTYNLDTQQKSDFIRPLQDITKIYKSKSKQALNFQYLKNETANLHAESNLVKNKDYVKESNYVGISKLSCLPCNEILGDAKLDHRGYHLTKPAKYVDPTTLQEIDLSRFSFSETKNIKEENPDLSFDDFEKKIGVILPNDENSHFHTNLAEIKTLPMESIVGNITNLCLDDCV